MRGLVRLSCVLMLLFCCTFSAQAATVKATGFWDMSTLWCDTDFSHNTTDDRFMAVQRLRTQLEIATSTSLKGVLQLETDANWGTHDYQGWSKGGALGTDGLSVKVKSSYIDWVIPQTGIAVRMGLQPVVSPGFVAGSNVFDDDIAGIAISTQLTDQVAMTVAWGRAFNDNNTANLPAGERVRDTADSFTLVVPVMTDTVKLIPWATYAVSGRDSAAFRLVDGAGHLVGYGAPQLMPAVWSPEVHWGTADNVEVLWLGLTGEWTGLESLRLAFDANYGTLKGAASQLDRTGWMFAALGEYRLTRMTPGIMGWYASGDDGNIHNGSERMPTFSADWKGTAFGWNDQFQSRGDNAGVMGGDSTGTWGVSLYLDDVQSLERMTHLFRVAYYQGTNDAIMASYISGRHAQQGLVPIGSRTWHTHQTHGLYLTTKDSVWEVNANTLYQIYENLACNLELGYMNLDLHKEQWGVADYDKHAYRVAATVRYSF